MIEIDDTLEAMQEVVGGDIEEYIYLLFNFPSYTDTIKTVTNR